MSFLYPIFNTGIHSDVPAWLFLFLSWFVLSLDVHIDKTDISTHNKVMSSYRDLVKLEMENKYLYEISEHIYRMHKQNKKTNEQNKEVNKWYNRMLKEITPGTMKDDRLISLIGYSSDISGEFKNGRIEKFLKRFKVLTIQLLKSISIPILLLLLIFWILYGVELNLNPFSVSSWIVTIMYYVFISVYHLMVLHSHIINWRISIKIYPKHFKSIVEYLDWIIQYYLSLVMMRYMVITSLVTSFTVTRHQSSYINFMVLLFILFILFIFPILEIWFYNKMNLDKKIDGFNCVIMDVFQSLYSKSTNKKVDLSNNDINIYKIAMSVYLRMFSYESYRDYMYSLGKGIDGIDDDLDDAYEKVKGDFE